MTLWLGWGLPAEEGRLSEGQEPPVRGTNDLGTIGYRAPEQCGRERVGRALRFSVLALDTTLDLREGATRDELEVASAGHVVAAGTLLARHKPERGLRTLLRR